MSTSASLIITVYFFYNMQDAQISQKTGAPLFINMRPLTPEIQVLTRVNGIMLAFLGMDWIVDSIKFENNIYNVAAALIQFSILRVIILTR